MMCCYTVGMTENTTRTYTKSTGMVEYKAA